MPASNAPRPWLPLAGFVAAAFAAGAAGSVATVASVHTWYPLLPKPTWGPPNWLFAPVWTTLYVFMGVAAWRGPTGSPPSSGSPICFGFPSPRA